MWHKVYEDSNYLFTKPELWWYIVPRSKKMG
jgi:hypothetical protein